MAAVGSALHKCREECGWGHVDVAARLIQQGFVSRYFSTDRELALLLSDLEASDRCLWECEEAVDFQLQCLTCFGIPGMRVSAALGSDRRYSAPTAGATLRYFRLHRQYSRAELADLLLAEGFESPLIDSRADLEEILHYMEQGALCPFMEREEGRFVEALRGALR